MNQSFSQKVAVGHPKRDKNTSGCLIFGNKHAAQHKKFIRDELGFGGVFVGGVGFFGEGTDSFAFGSCELQSVLKHAVHV